MTIWYSVPGLFKTIIVKNLHNSSPDSTLGPTYPFYCNFNSHQYLSDFEIQKCLYPIFLVQTYLLLFYKSLVFTFLRFSYSNVLLLGLVSSFNFPFNFVQKSQVLFKFKSFAWLVIHKKVYTADMLLLKRSYKALSPVIQKLRVEHEVLKINHPF